MLKLWQQSSVQDEIDSKHYQVKIFISLHFEIESPLDPKPNRRIELHYAKQMQLNASRDINHREKHSQSTQLTVTAASKEGSPCTGRQFASNVQFPLLEDHSLTESRRSMASFSSLTTPQTSRPKMGCYCKLPENNFLSNADTLVSRLDTARNRLSFLSRLRDALGARGLTWWMEGMAIIRSNLFSIMLFFFSSFKRSLLRLASSRRSPVFPFLSR